MTYSWCHNRRMPTGTCEHCGALAIPLTMDYCRSVARDLRRGKDLHETAAWVIEHLCERVAAGESRDVDADRLAFRTWYINDNGTECYHPEDLENAASAWHAALAWSRGNKGGAS